MNDLYEQLVNALDARARMIVREELGKPPAITGEMVRDAVTAEFDLYAVNVKGIGEYGASEEEHNRHEGLAWDRVAARLVKP